MSSEGDCDLCEKCELCCKQMEKKVNFEEIRPEDEWSLRSFESENSCWDFNNDYHSSRTSTKQIRKPTTIIHDHHLSIEMRNARERKRVRSVNDAFARLRKMVPYTANRNKRISKVKTLQKAVQYITDLERLLNSN